VEGLVAQLDEVRASSEGTSYLAHEVLQHESHEINKLMEYVDDDKVAQALEELDTADSTRFTGSELDANAYDPFATNVALKMELQRLELVESKLEEMVNDYKMAIENIRDNIDNIQQRHPQLLASLELDYKNRLREIDIETSAVISREQTMIYRLSKLRDNMKLVESRFDSALRRG
jgi:hypothetical protein